MALFINKPDSSKDENIFIISSYSLFEIINAVIPGIQISTADAAAVNPNGIRRLLANSVSTFFISGKPAVINHKVKKLSLLADYHFCSSFFK